MSIDSVDRKNEFVIVACAAFFVAVCFTLIRHFAGVWAPADAIDLASYWSGLQLFFSPHNPYDPHTMLQKQQELSIKGQMIWNPPVLFAILAPFLTFSLYWARLIWNTVTTVSIILSAYLSWKLATDLPALKRPGWVFYALFFCPYFYEISVEQISSFLTLLLILSIFLFKHGRYAFAGAVAALLLVKPHVFYLVFVWYLLVVIFEKRWSFCFGFILSIASGSILVELLHPGINMAWLTRESWPGEIVGSTLPSLIRAALFSCCHSATKLPQIIIPLLGVTAVAFRAWWDYRKSNFDKSLILAVLLCPITAPYGFVFDQVVLIFPIMVILGTAFDEGSPKGRRKAIIIGLAAVQLGILVVAGVKIFGMGLGWYPLPLLILLIWMLLGCPIKAQSRRLDPMFEL